jgi:enoyl-CoA hydratase/carnithine racemase
MTVRIEHPSPGVTTVVLDRPEARNAVDGPTAAALADAFRAFEADESQRVAVLYGEGGTFCAGADLKAIGTSRGNRVATDGDGPMGPTRMRLSKPVVAAIEGHAVAGGLELAIWCDLRVAARDAVLGVFCRRWGVPLIDGGTVRLPRLVGTGRALDLVLTGRAVPADEALAIGLVDRVVPTGEARAAAEVLARELAALPQECLRQDRLSVLEQEGLDEVAAMANELQHGLRSLEADALAGAQRFATGAGRHGAPAP